jgi:hypothetical protein
MREERAFAEWFGFFMHLLDLSDRRGPAALGRGEVKGCVGDAAVRGSDQGDRPQAVSPTNSL